MKIERRVESESFEGEGVLVDKGQNILAGKAYYFFAIDPDEEPRPLGFTPPDSVKGKEVKVLIFTEERLKETDGDWFLKTKEGLLLKLLRAEEVLLNSGRDPCYRCVAELLKGA